MICVKMNIYKNYQINVSYLLNKHCCFPYARLMKQMKHELIWNTFYLFAAFVFARRFSRAYDLV